MTDAMKQPEPIRSMLSSEGRGGVRPTTAIRRARLLADEGRFTDALEMLRQVAQSYPENARVRECLARVYYASGDNILALRELHCAVKLDPKNATLQNRLLKLLLDLGRFEEAEVACKGIIKTNPRSRLARDVLGVVKLRRGELNGAERIVDDLIRIDPTDAYHHYQKGFLLQHKGDAPGAMKWLMKALDMDPYNDLADQARASVAALDAVQIQHILLLAIEDRIFHTKLMLNTHRACAERGFRLSHDGLTALRQLDISSLPAEDAPRRYH